MNRIISPASRVLNYVLPVVVLLFLLIYTYAKFFEHPYTGFRLNSDGIVSIIFVNQQTQPTLQVGDQVIEINSVNWEDYRHDLRKVIFEDLQPGETIDLLVKRGNQQLAIPWKAAGWNSAEVRDLLISEGWLSLFFWGAGTFALLTLRPKDERWRLFIAFNYLTACFLTLGSGVSFYHIWNSAILLRIFVWFCIPVYLHLHWVFPKPLGRLPKAIVWLGYLAIGVVAVAQWFDSIPKDLYFTGYFLAVLGSVLLLIVHAVRQPETRQDLGILVAVIVTAFVPLLVISMAGGFSDQAAWGGLPTALQGGALLSLPLFPVAYFYAVHRRRLGNLELRVNGLLSNYLFLILIGLISLPFIILIAAGFSSAGGSVIFGTMGFLLASVLVLVWRHPFQTFFERRVLGIPLPSKSLLETYSAQITTSLSLSQLVQVLHEEVLPSLLIRQFAFLQIDQGSLHVLSTMGLREEPLPTESDIPKLVEESRIFRSSDALTRDEPFKWIRLILPLKLGDRLLGFWLLGRRDPDDLYSQQEIPILSSLANLTAIALSNILQTERLKSMYESNISRYEEERLSLAHDLHDSILNEMAALLISGDAPTLSPKFQRDYDTLTQRLRDIVDGLRPPMLIFGLKLALEDFAENLRERNQNAVEILTDIDSDGDWRYPELVENNVYRIVQEACENSLRHAHARQLLIFGKLHEKELDIRVEDNGVGLDPEISLKLNDLLVGKHFGLVGMLERANFIGAELSIHSKPGEGTRIQLIWKPAQK